LKKAFAIAGVLILVFAIVRSQQQPTVGLEWDDPNGHNPANTFYLYHSTNVVLPFSLWERIASFPGDATNGRIAKPTGPADFYFMTCSNFVGESYPFDR
jgi:hypothetical protein